MRRRLTHSAILTLLLVQFGLLALGARALSLTIDEPSHLAAGYAFLARGALWTIPQRGHPLLVDAWEALPFYIGHPDIPIEMLSGWETDYLEFVAAFTDYVKPDIQQAEFVTRVPAMLLTMLLAAVICRWAGTLWGEEAGALALLVLVFDPTLLAHGRLATNDVGVTALGTMGLYLLWRWSRMTTWQRAAAAGSVLGVTLLAKGSGLLWVAFGMGGAAWITWRTYHLARRVWPQFVLLALLPWLILWGGHRFAVGYLPGWPSIPVPAPQYWMGVLFQAEHADKPITYALGLWRETGWLWYFPFAFVIKNPLPFLIALLAGGGTLLLVPQRRHDLCLPVGFAVLYTITAIAIGPNLGYRHLLPVHPMLYLLVAVGICELWRVEHRRIRYGLRRVVMALGVWYVVGTLHGYPFNLAYFNELVGGPAEGWRYLEGSNTEWGQGWIALRKFEDEHAITPAYSGWDGYAGSVPEGLWSRVLPPTRGSASLFRPSLYPAPGDYVLSANTLSGALLVDPDNYAWFRYHSPDAVVAESLFYYHIDAAMAPVWLAQCNVPTVPLSDAAVAEGFGDLKLRTLDFDCRRTWVYPEGGRTDGMYALHDAILLPEDLRERLYLARSIPEDSFAARHIESARQSYRQWEYRAWPAFALYTWDKSVPVGPGPSVVGVARAEVVPLTMAMEEATPPLPLEESFAFLGISDASYDGEILEIETWWQVTHAPITRPLSIMAHLVAGEGTSLAVDDGLGVSPSFLEFDDIVVQRHRFAVSTSEEQVWLRTGLYYLDTMERVSVRGSPSADAIFAQLILRKGWFRNKVILPD